MKDNKNYEVLAYRHRPTTIATGKDVVIDRGSKHWSRAVSNEDGEYEIYTVRRDDGVDFSIGDRILGHDENHSTIVAIHNHKSQCNDLWLSVEKENDWGSSLSHAEKDVSNMKEEFTILQQAQNLIYGDRQASYGSVTENFSKIAAGWSQILNAGVSPEQVGLMMIWLKVCREVNKGSEDGIIDIAGYAGCIDKLRKGQ